MSKSRADLQADLAKASQQVNAANKALEAAQAAMAAHDESDDGKAESWMALHGIEVEHARDCEGEPLKSQYIVTTEEILALAASTIDRVVSQ